jgi:serine/threonine-protein kinase RsbW
MRLCSSEVDGMEIQMALYLPRDAVSVPVSRQVLDSCLETLGVTPDTRDDIALALSEACANVIQHAGPGEEYEVRVSARNCQCTIEVVNTGRPDSENAGSRDSESSTDTASAPAVPVGLGPGGERPGPGSGPGPVVVAAGGVAVADEPLTAMAEHGRGLKIIDAVADNVQLTGDERHGTTLHFEKKLRWLPGAAGQHLFNGDGGQ